VRNNQSFTNDGYMFTILYTLRNMMKQVKKSQRRSCHLEGSVSVAQESGLENSTTGRFPIQLDAALATAKPPLTRAPGCEPTLCGARPQIHSQFGSGLCRWSIQHPSANYHHDKLLHRRHAVMVRLQNQPHPASEFLASPPAGKETPCD